MRWWGLSVLGVALLLLGAVLMWVPLAVQPPASLTPPGPTAYAFSVGGYSLSGTIPVSIQWTEYGENVTIVAAACANPCPAGNVSALSDVTVETGTSGTITVNQPNGGEVIVAVVSFEGKCCTGGVQLKVFGAVPTEGSILISIGIPLIVLGLVLPPGRKPASTYWLHPPTPVEGTGSAPGATPPGA